MTEVQFYKVTVGSMKRLTRKGRQGNLPHVVLLSFPKASLGQPQKPPPFTCHPSPIFFLGSSTEDCKLRALGPGNRVDHGAQPMALCMWPLATVTAIPGGWSCSGPEPSQAT